MDMDAMDAMDAVLQVNAFGMTAGCTFCLDNLPNQLAVLGHFRAILEMCQNQCEGDPDQYESGKEVERQMKTVRLMIKMAQARSKSKAVKVEVMPCILSTSLNVTGEASASISMGSLSPKKSPSLLSGSPGLRGAKLPKLEEAQLGGRAEEPADSTASTSSSAQPVACESAPEKADSPSHSASGSASLKVNAPENPDSGSELNAGRTRSRTSTDPAPPNAPSSSSSFASRYMPSFLRKTRCPSKEQAASQDSRRHSSGGSEEAPESPVASRYTDPVRVSGPADNEEEQAPAPTLSQLQNSSRLGEPSIAARKVATDYSASSLVNPDHSDPDLSNEIQQQVNQIWPKPSAEVHLPCAEPAP